MTTTKSQLKLVGYLISDLIPAAYRPKVMPCIFSHFQKSKCLTNDVVTGTTEAVTEIWYKSGTPMKSTVFGSIQNNF